MTHAERILDAVAKRPGSSDAELRSLAGIDAHQAVNQVCRRLESEGRLTRRPRVDGRIGNYPADGPVPQAPTSSAKPAPPARPVPTVMGATDDSGLAALPPAPEALILLPCSKAKALGRVASPQGPAIADRLGPPLRDRLLQARAAIALEALVDESTMLPALHRYRGFLYAEAAPAIETAAQAGQRFAILSGGYGIVDPLEPIGFYERAFTRRDWPKGVLEDSLSALAAAIGVTEIIAFCSRTTGYAELVRRTAWQAHGLTARLVSPDTGGRRGAQRAVPITTGQAIVAHLRGTLAPGFTSTAGLGVTVEVIR